MNGNRDEKATYPAEDGSAPKVHLPTPEKAASRPEWSVIEDHPQYPCPVLRVTHRCTRPSSWPEAVALLPLDDGVQGWTQVRANPLTVTPSILCPECGMHGFITDGEWRAC